MSASPRPDEWLSAYPFDRGDIGQNINLILRTGISTTTLKRTGPVGLRGEDRCHLVPRVLGGKNDEGVRQLEGILPHHGDLTFLHRLKKSCLSLGRSPVDFVY